MRKIVHIDMDAFFASVEQRDNPELLGKPIAVGGSSARGVVAAASYEARKFGVKSAMPSVTAARLCPNLIFVQPRFEAYKQVSQQIREIFHEYTDLVEPLSLDEAYLDVTYNKKQMDSAVVLAKEIKAEIKKRTGLSASAGISYNKFLAKIASDVKKPNGLFLVHPDRAEAFIEKLPIEKFFGIGKVTAKKMHILGILTGKDLKNFSQSQLVQQFGKSGIHYHQIANGIDERAVNPKRIRKSIGVENTYEKDICSLEEVRSELSGLLQNAVYRLRKNQRKAKTLTIKIKFSDFRLISRSRSSRNWLDNDQLPAIVDAILENLEQENFKIRLLGIGFSNLDNETKLYLNQQLTLDF